LKKAKMVRSLTKQKLIANLEKARAARKLNVMAKKQAEERIRKNLLRKQMAAERIARIQRHYATTSALFILAQVAIGAL
jgi:hypothetical protein